MEPSLLCGLIGAGIQGWLSRALQEEEAHHHGLRLHYQLIDLETAGRGVEVLATLIEAARMIGFAGLNVTYPCEQLVMPLLDELSEEAAVIGAVDTVVRRGDRLVGHNTDGAGWSWGFRRILPAADLSRVVLVGPAGRRVRRRRAPPGRGAPHDRRPGRVAGRGPRRAAERPFRRPSREREHRPGVSAGPRQRPHPRDADRDGERARAAVPRRCCDPRSCRTSSTCRSTPPC